MIVSKRKPIEQILHALREDQKVFLVGCAGCAEAVGAGGEVQTGELKQELEQAGKVVTGWVVIDFLCNKTLVGRRLARYLEPLEEASALVVLSCGVGVQAVSAVVEQPTYPANDSISLGGLSGVWRSDERCATCGNCVLEYTGGICPVTMCAKGLLNGPCGGSQNGECEVEPGRPCGWMLIYERLKQLNRVERLKEFVPPRDYSKMLPHREVRESRFWALEREGGDL